MQVSLGDGGVENEAGVNGELDGGGAGEVEGAQQDCTEAAHPADCLGLDNGHLTSPNIKTSL